MRLSFLAATGSGIHLHLWHTGKWRLSPCDDVGTSTTISSVIKILRSITITSSTYLNVQILKSPQACFPNPSNNPRTRPPLQHHPRHREDAHPSLYLRYPSGNFWLGKSIPWRLFHVPNLNLSVIDFGARSEGAAQVDMDRRDLSWRARGHSYG